MGNAISHIFQRLRQTRQIEVFRTLLIRRRTGARRILLFRGARVYVASTAVVSVPGRLRVGCRWPRAHFLPGQLVVHDGAALSVLEDFEIFGGCRISVNEGAHLVLGGGYANYGLNLVCFERIEVGRGVAIGENVTIRDSDTYVLGRGGRESAPIRIGDSVWIGLNATILKGVSIGEGAVIAAGAVVNRDVPARTLVAGVPARVKRTGVSWGLPSSKPSSERGE